VTALKNLNLAALFFTELGVLVAAVAFGWHQHQPVVVRLLIGIAITAVLATTWGMFAAPKAKNRLRGFPLAAFETVWFLVGVVLLTESKHAGWAAALAVVTVVSKILAAAWHQ
jgi:Protein of unknown function (DUF2568)